MVIFKSRPISRSDIFLVFAACIFPIHLWAIWNLLQVVPAWILRLTVWELAGVVAYTQMFALFESLVVLAALLVLAVLLPSRLFAQKFVPYSSALILLNSAWFVAAQYYYEVIRLWGVMQFLPWLALYLITNAAVYTLIKNSARFETAIQSITRRVAVLSVVYLTFSVFSVFVIVIRNL